MKAIPTFYKGISFRSRLEARWAVFFDLLNLNYWYEPEQYDFGEYGQYIPDFYLPDLGVFVEIKGAYKNCFDAIKPALLAVSCWREKQLPNHVVVCQSPPLSRGPHGFCFFCNDNGELDFDSCRFPCVFTLEDNGPIIAGAIDDDCYLWDGKIKKRNRSADKMAAIASGYRFKIYPDTYNEIMDYILNDEL